MGAYENENGTGPYDGPVWYVDASSELLPYANGSESAKFSKIQYGINAAAAGDTVLVAAGTYVENINFDGKNIAVIGADREATIIDGDSSGSVVTLNSGESFVAVLSGFTLQNGSAENGGGVSLEGASPTITNVTISGNTSNSNGGGMRLSDSDAILTNVTIKGNTATNGGGGISLSHNCYPTLTNVTISGNTAGSSGGGIQCEDNSHPILLNTIIAGNESNEIEFSSDYDSSTITISYSGTH